jgi:hypothetical protein
MDKRLQVKSLRRYRFADLWPMSRRPWADVWPILRPNHYNYLIRNEEYLKMKIIIDTRGALKIVLNKFTVIGRFNTMKDALEYCDSMTYYDEDLNRYLTYTQNLRNQISA